MTSPSQDTLSGVVALASTAGKWLNPFANVTISSNNGSGDFVTCYVLNDNLTAGSLDASALPAGSAMALSGTLVVISGSVAVVQQALRALTFDANAIAAGTTQSAHLTIAMTNTSGGVTSDRTVYNSTVNDTGINVAFQNMPVTSAVADTGVSVFLPKLVVVSAAGDTVGVTVSMSDRTLGAFNTSALTGVGLVTNADGSLTLQGSAASVSTALEALRFVPTAQVMGTTSSEVFTLAAVDQTNGTTTSGTTTVAISGSQSALSLSGAQSTATVNGGSSNAIFQALTVQNRVSAPVTATVKLSDATRGHFDLSALPGNDGVSAVLNSSGDTLVLSGATAAVQSDLRLLRFVATNPASGSTTEQVTLGLATATNGTVSTSETLTIAYSGTAPVLSPVAAVSLSSGAASLYPSLSVSGPLTTVTATVTLSDVGTAAFDQAAFSTAESGNGAIAYSFSADGSSLTIQGSASDIGTALGAVGLKTTTPKSGVVTNETATLSISADAGSTTQQTVVSVTGAPLVADSVSGIAGSALAVEGTTVTPFAQATIVDTNIGDTVSATITSSIAGVFQSGSLAAGAVLSSDGSSVTVSGSAAAVQAALAGLALRLPMLSDASQLTLTVQVGNQAGSSSFSAAPVSQLITIRDPGYTSNTGSDDTGTVFAVGSDPNWTATLDLSNNPGSKIVVFGGDSALSLRAANSIVVLNGDNQTGALSLQSLGNDAVWTGVGAVDLTAGGHDRLIMGSQDNVSTTVTIHGGTTADSNEVDVWGDSSELQTINTDGVSSNVIFGGGARLAYTGGNSTVVLNGSGQIGDATIHSTGGNTIWAGTATLDLYEGAGTDTVVLTGGAATTIHGATSNAGGTTSVLSLSNTGTFTYDGGAKAASLSLSGGSNVVQGGSAKQTIAMSGSGSLLVSDDGSTVGLQSIVMQQDSTASLRFLGGSNPATLVLGAGAATIDAGTGTSITGGSGTATIDLSTAAGAMLVFDGSRTGNIDITGYDPSRASVQLSSVVGSSVQNGSLVVSFADGAHATFHGDTDASHSGISFT